MCPEQKTKIGYISLSRRTVVKHVEKISDSFMHQLRDASKDFLLYSLALDLDESTDVQDTAQLLVFIRGKTLVFSLSNNYFVLGHSNTHSMLLRTLLKELR